MTTSVSPHPNRIIASLSTEEQKRFLSNCEQVKLAFGDILNEPGEKILHVYFPTDSFISLVMPMDGNPGLEVALIGDEGMHGILLLLGVETSQLHAVVQGSGAAWRMGTKIFQRELKRSVTLQQKLHFYTYVLMRQLAQTAACNRFHLVEARLARWLLMTRDRAHSDQFYITHEFLARMLGVRRSGVTKAAGSLQKMNLIHYSRGSIKILTSLGLEAASCSCYQSDKDIYAHILPY